MQTGNESINENCVFHQTHNQMCGDHERNKRVTDWELKILDDSFFCHSFIIQDVFLRRV
jgi:hypothetical protein